MFMTRGGHKVGKGTYWNLREGQRIDIADEGLLPGDEKTKYVRISALGMLVLGPVIGLLYAILMPLIGIATVVALAGQKILKGMYNLVAKSISFHWEPRNAYLSGKKKKRKEKK